MLPVPSPRGAGTIVFQAWNRFLAAPFYPAADAAQEMVAKLSGAQVSNDQAAQAVKAAMANG